MKIRRSILIGAIVCGIVAVLVILLAKHRPNARPTTVEKEAESLTNQPAQIEPTKSSLPSSVKNEFAGNSNRPAEAETKSERMKSLIENINTPITFYGKVEDQFGNPVSGVEVSGNILVYNGYSGGHQMITAVSDGNGSFRLDGGKGESIGIMLRKEGYAMTTVNTEFKYSNIYDAHHIPDASDPILFKMRKLQGAEKLFSFNFRAHIPLDGQPARFDLKTGQVVKTGGDVLISLRSASKPDVVQRYDWKMTIEVPSGGICLSDSGWDQMFEAPDSGYAPQTVVGYSADTKPWSSRFNGNFYVRLQERSMFGKVSVAVTTDIVKASGVPIMLSGYVNPSNSRNLEIDPKLITSENQ